ncbi:adenylosuccinate lyase [bacterium]|nr:adenylosuccinate lyase [bacterium]
MIKRYTRPQMGSLFADGHKFDTWLQVELAVCAAWAKEGAIPTRSYERIRRKARFSIKRIEEIEAQVNHDVIAFTSSVAESIGADSAYFHKGLTSSDVVDTAQSIILKQAGQIMEDGLSALKAAVGRRALEHKHTLCIGRTHGVHAEPTTFGLKLLIWYDELNRQEERLALAIDNLAVGKLSGAVGNFAYMKPEFEEGVLKRLGLRSAPVSNQIVQRDRHAHFVSVLAGLGATMEKIAVNLRTYQRTEISEVQEAFQPGQKGSSAMPHKRNPVLLERVSGLARVLRGYAATALENVALWDERDISHSGAERIILPDACVLTDYMLATLAGVVENLVISPERMEHNIYFTKGLIFSQRVLLKLAEKGLSREDAYALVQENAMRCWEDGTPLLDALLIDRRIRAVLSTQEISALFTLEPYLVHVDELFRRVGLTEVKAKGKTRRRRGRGKVLKLPEASAPREEKGKLIRGASGNIESIAVETGAVQNIAERASDYYESASVTTTKASIRTKEPDETLGEAEHQKKTTRRRTSRRRRGPREVVRRKKKSDDDTYVD